MKTYLKYLSIMGLVVSLALFGSACSSTSSDSDDDDDAAEDEDGDVTSATVTSSTLVSGAYTASGSLLVD